MEFHIVYIVYIDLHAFNLTICVNLQLYNVDTTSCTCIVYNAQY